MHRKMKTKYVGMPGHRRRWTAREAAMGLMAAALVLALMAGGAVVLALSGIFTPVEATAPMVEEPGDELPISPPPSTAGLAQLLVGETPRVVTLQASAKRSERKSGVSAEQREAIIQEIRDGNMQAFSALADPWDIEQILAAIQDEPNFFVPDTNKITVKKGELNPNAALPENWINILLLGSDNRDQKSTEGRSDVMIILSVNRENGEIKMSSLARDLYVELPKLTGTYRLNVAHAYGGPNLAMLAVNNLLDMNITRYASVNLHGLAGIIDVLGGVTLELVAGEAEQINYNVAVSEDYEGFAKSEARLPLKKDQVGPTRLDGLQAVGYARIRHLDNDMARNNRQRILLQTLADMLTVDATPQKILLMANVFLPYTTTNIPLSEIVRMGGDVLQVGMGAIQSFSVPYEGSFQYVQTDESSVLQADMLKNKQALHTFIYGEYIPRSK